MIDILFPCSGLLDQSDAESEVLSIPVSYGDHARKLRSVLLGVHRFIPDYGERIRKPFQKWITGLLDDLSWRT